MRTSFRTAGWGTLGFSIAFFVAFVVNSLMSIGSPEVVSATDLAAAHWPNVLFSALWGAAGVALVVSVVGLAAVVWPSGGLVSRIATGFGFIAAAGWLLSGVWSLAQRGPLLTSNIVAAGADPAAERAVVELGFVGVHAGALLFGFAAIPWLGLVAWQGGRSRTLPRLVVVLLGIAAVGTYAVFAMTGLPFGNLVIWAVFLVVGAVLVRRARRLDDGSATQRSEATAPAA